jgi:protein subunit release factor A
MKLIVEIRAAEGGEDSKLLVAEQAAIYTAFAKRIGAEVRDSHVGKG